MGRTTISILAFAIGAGAAFGQEAQPEPQLDPPPEPGEPPAAPPRLTFGLRGTADWAFPADLGDGAGEVSVGRVGATLDVSYLIDERSRFGLRLGEEFSFYDFADVTLLASGEAPIDDASETTVGLSYSRQLDDRWSIFGSATAIASAETGADFGDSLTYSGIGIASYAINERLTIGGGVLARTRLEDDVLVIPVVTVDWKIDDRWTLTNAGGSGGARATLAYQHSDAWRFFGDVGFEGREFRLDDDGPIPDGIGRDQRLPVGLGALYTPNKNFAIQLRAGAHFLQSLEFDDSSGDEIADSDIDPTGFISLMVSLRM